MEAFTESGLSSQVVTEIQEIIPAIIPTADMTPALQNKGIDLYFKVTHTGNFRRASGGSRLAGWNSTCSLSERCYLGSASIRA